MKLNYDCLRDLLIALEYKLILNEQLEIPFITLDTLSNVEVLSKYDKATIAYTIQKAEEAGLIKANITYASGMIYNAIISTITFAGHQYLDNIRNDSIWNKVKEKIISVGGSLTTSLISQVAENVLKQTLGL